MTAKVLFGWNPSALAAAQGQFSGFIQATVQAGNDITTLIPQQSTDFREGMDPLDLAEVWTFYLVMYHLVHVVLKRIKLSCMVCVCVCL